MEKKLRLAIVGTNGVPNQYGGFETLVEYLAEYLHDKYDITIYCSKTQKTRIKEYKGCRLVYLPLKANGWQGILFDSLSMLITTFRYDRILVLGCSSIIVSSLLRPWGRKYVLNIGGIDWRRNKWGKLAKWMIHTSEKVNVPICKHIISDNEGIREYIKETYNKDSFLIEYGGDQVTYEPITEDARKKYPFLNGKYALVVARIQSDNNIEMSIKGCLNYQYPLVVIGNWNSCQYGIDLRKKYADCKNIIMLDAIYDQKILNIIRSNASMYIHGHSGGGTNPSLVEIMTLKVPIICFNNRYNNFTTEDKSMYYNNDVELSELLNRITSEDIERIKEDLYEVARRRYTWQTICDKYAEVIDLG